MADLNPQSTDRQNNPDHTLMHNVYSIDSASPNDSVAVGATGNVTVKYRLLQPMAEIAYFDPTGTTITISGTSDGSTNMVVVNPATTFENDSGFDNGGANNGRLRYTGATTRMFHTAITISMDGEGAGTNNYVFGIAKNGTVDTTCKIIASIPAIGNVHSTALHCMVELATNDYIELYVGNMTDTDDITVKSLNIFAMGM